MSYQRTTRQQRHLRYARAKKERVNTGLGILFNTMRFLGLARIARLVVRRPWHVADLYMDGSFVRALHIYPKENMGKRIDRLNREAALALKRTHQVPVNRFGRNHKFMHHVRKNGSQ